MKKLTLLICAMLALMLVSPVLASTHTPTGDQINLFYSGSQEFPAGTAFFIRHGWVEGREYPVGIFDFELEVDGVLVRETYVERTITVGEDGPEFHFLWVFNFPDGMTGVHTFAGHWFVPCQYALDQGYDVTCSNPAQRVEVKTTEVEVTFTP